MSNTDPRWGGVAHSGHYRKARKTASVKEAYGAGSCAILSNGAGTRADLWHVSGTSGSVSVRVTEAAEWYRENRENCTGRAVASLRERFGITAKEIVQAIRIANGGAA